MPRHHWRRVRRPGGEGAARHRTSSRTLSPSSNVDIQSTASRSVNHEGPQPISATARNLATHESSRRRAWCLMVVSGTPREPQPCCRGCRGPRASSASSMTKCPLYQGRTAPTNRTGEAHDRVLYGPGDPWICPDLTAKGTGRAEQQGESPEHRPHVLPGSLIVRRLASPDPRTILSAQGAREGATGGAQTQKQQTLGACL